MPTLTEPSTDKEVVDIVDQEPEQEPAPPELPVPPSMAADRAQAEARQRKHKEVWRNSSSSSDMAGPIGHLVREGSEIYDPEKFIATIKENWDREGVQVSEREWEEVQKLVRELPSITQGLDSKISALMTKPENSGNFTEKEVEKKVTEIIQGLCESVINGHITVADLQNIVHEVTIISKEEMAADPEQYKGGNYDGVMFYNPATRSIVITESVLADSITENGETTKNDTDFIHLASHELAHGVVKQRLLPRAAHRELRAYKEGRQNEFSSDILRRTFRILATAKETMDFQSQHVRAVLSKLEQLKSTGNENPTPERQAEFAQKLRSAEAEAAEEIITDYTAIYLQSDKTKSGFIRKCIESTSASDLAAFMQQATGGEGGPAGAITKDNAVKVAHEKLAGLNNRLQNGEITLDQFPPKMAEMYQTYSTFFRFIGDKDSGMPELKGRFKERVEEDESEYYNEYAPDRASSNQKQEQTGSQPKSEGLVNEVVGFAQAFEELDIMSPVSQ